MFVGIMLSLVHTRHLHFIINQFTQGIAFFFSYKQHQAEAEEAELEAKKLGLNGESSLQALIQKKQQSREAAAEDFFSQLEAKYSKPQKAGSKRKAKK